MYILEGVESMEPAVRNVSLTFRFQSPFSVSAIPLLPRSKPVMPARASTRRARRLLLPSPSQPLLACGLAAALGWRARCTCSTAAEETSSMTSASTGCSSSSSRSLACIGGG